MRRGRQLGHDVGHERGAALRQRLAQQVGGLFDLAVLQQDRGVVGLAAEIAGFGRTPVPGQCGLRVAACFQTLLQVPGQQVHRLGMAQVGRAAVQGQGGGHVA